MRNGAAPSIRVGLLAAALLLGSAVDARAQRGVILGFVTDPEGGPLREATISILALERHARTGRGGRFVLSGLPRGVHDVAVRRLGYEPLDASIVVTAEGLDTVVLRMVPRPAELAPIQVTERERRWLEGLRRFHERRAIGLGTYVTREDIEQRHAARPSDVLRNKPGIRFVRARSGHGIRFARSSIIRSDCMPMMWVDGQRAPGMEIDDIPIHDIEGIELYAGPSTTPMEFSPGPTTTCGTIVVWSRIPGS